MNWSVDQFYKYIRRPFDRMGQFIRRNKVTSAVAGLLLVGVFGCVIATTWQAYRARTAKAREHPSNDKRQLVDLRLLNYKEALDNLTDQPRTPEEPKPAHYDVVDQDTLGLQGHRAIALERDTMVPATYQLVADNSKDRVYRRNPPLTYPNPGGFLYLTNVDPAALGPNAGDYLALVNQPQAALNAFRTRLAIDEQAITADPDNLKVQADLAYSSSRIGDLLADMGDLVGALPYYQRGVDIYTKTKNAAIDPEEVTVPFELARLLVKLSRTHAKLGYTDKAWAENMKAADLLESAFDNAANVEQRRIRASLYTEIGDVYSLLAGDTRTPQQFMNKLWSAARATYERSLAILSDLRQRGVLTEDELAEIDNINHKIAECDLFLSK
jgi:tetratricopeptide (TPR) repeat protein